NRSKRAARHTEEVSLYRDVAHVVAIERNWEAAEEPATESVIDQQRVIAGQPVDGPSNHRRERRALDHIAVEEQFHYVADGVAAQLEAVVAGGAIVSQGADKDKIVIDSLRAAIIEADEAISVQRQR